MKKCFLVLLALTAVASQAFGIDIGSFLIQNPDVGIGLSGLAAMGAIKTQGTDLYAIDPETDELLIVGCVTSIEGIDTTVEQVETTCLQETARSYIAGLATPGAATFGINTDTADAAHIRLHQIKVLGLTVQWAIGWADGTADPAVDTNGTFNLPTSRSWLTFEGFMNSFPFSFAQNSVVQSTVGIQVSGEPELHAKV